MERVLKYWADKFGIENTSELRYFMACYSKQELARPFVIEDLLNQVEPGTIMMRYGISRSQLRTIQIQIDVCKKYWTTQKDSEKPKD